MRKIWIIWIALSIMMCVSAQAKWIRCKVCDYDYKENYDEKFHLHIKTKTEDIRWNDLIESVIQVESGGDYNAYNEKSRAMGLMQITPIVLKEYNIIACANSQGMGYLSSLQLFFIDDNIEVGTWYIRRLHYHYGLKTIPEILAAYNFGIGNARKGKPYPQEIRDYIQKVLKIYNKGE